MKFATREMMSLGSAAALALILAAACHDATDTSTAPKLQPLMQLTSGTVCTKVTPPGDYFDRPAECVEVSGPTTISAGGSASFTCRGWGRTSPEFNDWYEVFPGRARTWWSSDQSVLSITPTSFQQTTVSAVAPGTTSVNCTIDGVPGSLEVTVTGTRTLVSMFVLPNPVPTLHPGQGTDVATNFVDNYNQVNKIHPPVDEWQSDNTDVATVGPPFQFGGQVARVTGVAGATPNLDGTARVRARVGSIWSSSSPVTVRPYLYVSASVQGGVAFLTWAPVPNATSYRVYRRALNLDPAGSCTTDWELWNETTATEEYAEPVIEYLGTGSYPGVPQYAYRVTIVRSGVESSPSVTHNFRTWADQGC